MSTQKYKCIAHDLAEKLFLTVGKEYDVNLDSPNWPWLYNDANYGHTFNRVDFNNKFQKVQPTPTAELLKFQSEVNELINNWQDAIADKIFGSNMDLDQPRDYRVAQIELAKKTVGYVAENTEIINVKAVSKSNMTWQLTANTGVIEVSIFLNPDLPENIQVLTVLPVI